MNVNIILKEKILCNQCSQTDLSLYQIQNQMQSIKYESSNYIIKFKVWNLMYEIQVFCMKFKCDTQINSKFYRIKCSC